MKTSNMVSPSASQKPSRDKSSSLNKRSKSMKHTLVRIAIGVPEAFNALSAIGGGIVLLAGIYKESHGLKVCTSGLAW
jgi:hypothetical protein